jgi:hypothetical protein
MDQRIVHPRAELVRGRVGQPRGNFHSRVGLVIGAGPSIAACGGPVEQSPLDFAPLFLHLLGGPPPTTRSTVWLKLAAAAVDPAERGIERWSTGTSDAPA